MGKALAVTSGKGGVGKSTFCCNIAKALVNQGKTVVLLELDFGLRGLDLMLGVSNTIVYDLGDLFQNRCTVNDIIVQAQQGLSLIAAPLRFGVDVQAKDLVFLISLLKEHYDYVLVDSPAGFGLAFEVITTAADQIFVITIPDLISVRDANNVVRELLERKFHNFRLIINRVNRKTLKKSGIDDLDYIINETGAQLMGVIPEDSDFARYIAQAKPIDPNSAVYKVFENVAQRVLGKYVPLLVQ